jgi:L-arabinokinase
MTFEIVSGTTRGLADTESFIELLSRLPEHVESRSSLPGHLTDEGGAFFRPRRELFVTRAPGRLDLMGGIADYSGSLVLELPTSAATHAALQLEDGDALTVISLAPAGRSALASDERDTPRRYEMSLAEFVRRGSPVPYEEARARFASDAESHWAAYVAGAFLALMRERRRVFERGARLLVRSDVPEGKGVSSSAALEVAVMRAVAAAHEIELSPRETAFLCQRVENLVAGAPCGVMDQMTAAGGEEGRLLALLCQPCEARGHVSLPPELSVWGVDSGVRHSVGGADYGTVRAAAFMGYRMIADFAGLRAREAGAEGRVEIEDPKWHGYLANVSPAEFEGRYAPLLPERVSGAEFLARYRGTTDQVTGVEPDRVYPVLAATRHPVREHARVAEFAEALRGWRGLAQARRLGELMYESHASYSACGLGSEGTDELVRLVREAGPARGLYGAKITGGGSGGTVAILGRSDAGDEVAKLADEYAGGAGVPPLVLGGSSPGACRFGHLVLK